MKHSSSRRLFVLILAAITLAGPAWLGSVSSAGDSPGPEEIYGMDLGQLMQLKVVTATRTRVKLKETPSAVYVITEKEIRQRGYRTLVDALCDVPGFSFQHTYGVFPDLVHQRGFVGNNQRSLVYIDGILDNNISENAVLGGTLRYPLYNVKRIEIVAGPVSALYGANAFNGVINIITKDGNNTTGREVLGFAGSWMDTDYMGGGGAFSLNGHSPADTGTFAYSIGGYYYNSDGPDFSSFKHLDGQGRGYWWSDTYDNSEEDTYNITAKFSYGNLRFEAISWQYLQGEGTFANGTYQIDTDKDGFSGSEWSFRDNSYSIGYLSMIAPGLSLDSEAVVRHTDILSSSHESYPDTPGPGAYDHPDDVTSVSGYARPDYSYELEERLQWQPVDQLDNTLGMEAIYYVVPEGYGSSERYKYRNYAGYLQSIYKMSGMFSMIGGYRFDHNTSYGDSHTYRISAVGNPGDFTIKAMFSTGFRGPSAWELLDETRQREKNMDLAPEKMRSAEIGIGYTLQNIGHIGIQGYYNVIRDIILEVQTNDPNPNPEIDYWNQNRNVGKARVMGVELNSELDLTDQLRLYMNYTYSAGRYYDLPGTLINPPTAHGSNDIPNIPRHKINAGITYNPLPDLSLHLRSNYVYERKTIRTNPVEEVDDYILFHANVLWENAFIDGLYFQLLIKNLFDNDEAFDPGIRTATGEYYPTQHPIEGRNVWLTVGYRF